jgi:hypothetical protein
VTVGYRGCDRLASWRPSWLRPILLLHALFYPRIKSTCPIINRVFTQRYSDRDGLTPIHLTTLHPTIPPSRQGKNSDNRRDSGTGRRPLQAPCPRTVNLYRPHHHPTDITALAPVSHQADKPASGRAGQGKARQGKATRQGTGTQPDDNHPRHRNLTNPTFPYRRSLPLSLSLSPSPLPLPYPVPAPAASSYLPISQSFRPPTTTTTPPQPYRLPVAIPTPAGYTGRVFAPRRLAFGRRAACFYIGRGWVCGLRIYGVRVGARPGGRAAGVGGRWEWRWVGGQRGWRAGRGWYLRDDVLGIVPGG